MAARSPRVACPATSTNRVRPVEVVDRRAGDDRDERDSRLAARRPSGPAELDALDGGATSTTTSWPAAMVVPEGWAAVRIVTPPVSPTSRTDVADLGRAVRRLHDQANHRRRRARRLRRPPPARRRAGGAARRRRRGAQRRRTRTQLQVSLRAIRAGRRRSRQRRRLDRPCAASASVAATSRMRAPSSSKSIVARTPPPPSRTQDVRGGAGEARCARPG